MGSTHLGAGHDEVHFPSVASFCLTGYLSEKVEGLYMVFGNYDPGMTWLINGTICTAETLGYSANGTLAALFSQYFSLKGLLPLNHEGPYQTKGHLRAVKSTSYATGGVLRQAYDKTVKACGMIRPIMTQRYEIFGRILGYFGKGYKTTGFLSGTAHFVYKAVAEARFNFKKGFKLRGFLSNYKGEWFIRAMGEVSTKIYLFSVPSRMQQFISEKRWFRNE